MGKNTPEIGQRLSLGDAERAQLEDLAAGTLEAAWREEGYTSPNLSTYPWLWLWDSCFHSIIWTALGDERAHTELEAVFANQTRDGFVPHMGYQHEPTASRELWGRDGASIITQPPMYGHAIRRLVESGFDVSDSLVEAAARGLDHLWRHRMRDTGLLVIVHPWESGCDDSARWGSWMPDPFEKSEWDLTKRRLVDSLVVEDDAAVANPDFEVESAGFNALCAFNARELGAVMGTRLWGDRATELSEVLVERWGGSTWTDGPHVSGDVDTVEALLPLLLGGEFDVADAWDALTDPDRFGAPFGPRQTARNAPTYQPDRYWRGPAWPQLSYLLWVAARLNDRSDLAQHMAVTTGKGALASGFAEYWNAEDGHGLGAIPQSWTGLAWLMSEVTP